MKVFPLSPSRYIRHIRWRARPIVPRLIDWSDEFTPFSSERTDSETCVISNGIPKAGTHLLNALIENLGVWKHTEVFITGGKYNHQFRGKAWDTQCRPQSSVKKLRNGQMVIGHVPWSSTLEKSLGQVKSIRRIKHLLIYRDPRDGFASAFRWVFYPKMRPAYSETTDKEILWREGFTNDNQRLSYILKEPRFWTFPGYERWLLSPNCLAIKFEDLYPEIVELQHNILGITLRRIFDYLEIDASSVNAPDLYTKVHGKSPTASTEADKIGQYKRVFKDEHYAMLDTPEFRKTLSNFRYEW